MVSNHFTGFVENQDQNKCNYYSQEYTCKSSFAGTNTLKNHIEKCLEYKIYQDNQKILTQKLTSGSEESSQLVTKLGCYQKDNY